MASKAETKLTTFTIGGKRYSVPPMNLLASRYYAREMPPLYTALRDAGAAYRAAVEARELDSTAPDPNPVELAVAQEALIDAQIEIVSIRLASTATDPALQDEPEAPTFAHMTPDRIRQVMRASEQEDWAESFNDFVAASAFVRKGETTPAGDGTPSASEKPTTSSTKSSSRSRAR
jgi:hypothetical protein